MRQPGRRRSASTGGATYSAPALEKGFDVIELLATAPEGLTVSDIAAGLGRSISEIFRMIIVMEQREWLFKDAESDRYRVTYKLLDLAHRATPALELAVVAAPILQALSQRTEQSCHLVVQHCSRALILLRQESPAPIGLAARLGTAVDLIASSSGHVLLAFSGPEQLESTLERAPFPPSISETQLRDCLAQVRERGYETMPSARVAGVRDMSYPVFGFDSRVIAALTIPFLTFIDGSQMIDFDHARELLAEAARDISFGLGGQASLLQTASASI